MPALPPPLLLLAAVAAAHVYAEPARSPISSGAAAVPFDAELHADDGRLGTNIDKHKEKVKKTHVSAGLFADACPVHVEVSDSWSTVRIGGTLLRDGTSIGVINVIKPNALRLLKERLS
eukprot:COSAG06_NODE_2734_length_6368_cov_44.250439_2_plen_119_part_00